VVFYQIEADMMDNSETLDTQEQIVCATALQSIMNCSFYDVLFCPT
jgi:hypothetical protein